MNQKGFTLIETLLVLAVLTIIIIISTQIVMKINEKNEIDHFFEQLQYDILTVQSYSIEKNSIMSISFLSSSNTYRASHNFGNILFERKIPDSIQFDSNSNLKKIEFTSGKIRNFGTVMFNHKNKKISFIVYIERGRTRIVE